MAGIVVCALLGLVVQSIREPRYHGEPLGFWVEQLVRDTPHPDTEKVLKEAGGEALPVLKRAIKANDSLLRRTYRTVYPQLPLPLRRRLPKPRPREVLLRRVVDVLGASGIPSLSTLVLLFHDSDWLIRHMAVRTVGEMKGDKTDAISGLIGLLRGSDVPMQAMAANVLGGMGPTARPAVPDLSRSLDAPAPGVQMDAALALWRVDRDTNVLPVITRNLKKCYQWKAILNTLAEMGPAARPAVEGVLEAIPRWERVSSGPLEIRDAARLALYKIDPEAADRIEDPPGFGSNVRPFWMPSFPRPHRPDRLERGP